MKKNKMETIGSKPDGWLGKIAGIMMNTIHSSAYRKIINNHISNTISDFNNKTVLDIGCGGGISVKLFSDLYESNKVVGIDYSEEMVQLASKLNRRKIDSGKVEILNADVSKLPFADLSFDLITAFDTVNFWPDHEKAISEVIRVLKPDGVFFIINAYPKEGSKWYDFVKFKSDAEYRKYLADNGLKNAESAFEKNTVIVWGRK